MIQWLRSAYRQVRRCVDCVKLLGPNGVGLAVRTLSGRHGELQVSLEKDLRVWVRPNSTDLATLLQIFWQQEYQFDLEVPPRVIIDGGANVGYSTLYFAQRYPNARIIAVEPHPENFLQLSKNIQGHANITAVQGAIWHEDKVLGLWDPNEGHWGFRVTDKSAEASQLQIHGITIASLIAKFDLDYVDLLKLDIEGSEKEVFEHASAWIDHVGVIVAEMHDKYRAGCSRAFYGAIKEFPHEKRIGENILVMREDVSHSSLMA